MSFMKVVAIAPLPTRVPLLGEIVVRQPGLKGCDPR